MRQGQSPTIFFLFFLIFFAEKGRGKAFYTFSLPEREEKRPMSVPEKEAMHTCPEDFFPRTGGDENPDTPVSRGRIADRFSPPTDMMGTER